MVDRRAKISQDLERLKLRCDEFNDYGEVDMMQQYVADTRAIYARLDQVMENIKWLHKEEVIFKLERTRFIDYDEVVQLVDPFSKLFYTIYRWQRAEKK